jgi:C-terminal processing protease CtpA/Prc
MLLYIALLGAVFYLNTLNPLMGITAERDANGQWIVTDLMPVSTAYDKGVKTGALIKSVDGESAQQIEDTGPQDFTGTSRQ